jgi:hypothetical protein
MNHSSKKQHHEQARKKHKHDAEAHARDLARQKPNTTFMWLLGIGVAIIIAVVVATLVW